MTEVRRRLASTTLAAALLGGAAVPAVVLAPVAAAHSVLLSVDPQDGAVLEASPGQVTLAFNEDINRTFASVAVTSGGDRTNLVVGEPVVDGGTVTVRLGELSAGEYTIGYRATSADGHVIAGSSVFTVAGASSAAAPAGTAGAASEPGASSATADQQLTGASESQDPDSGINPALWVVGGLAVLLIGGAVVLLRRGG